MHQKPKFNKDLFLKYRTKQISKKRSGALESYMSFMTAIRLVIFVEMIFAIIAYIVIYNFDLTWEHWIPITVLIIGFFCAIWIVIIISNKIKLSDVYDRHLNSNDVDDIIIKEQQNLKDENS